MTRKATLRPESSLDTLAHQTCELLGLDFDGVLPAPGKDIKRLRETRARSSAKPGWLRIFSDGRGGIAGNWKTGEKLPFFLEQWTSAGISTAVVAARKAEIRRAQQVAEEERQELAAKAALRAAKLWQRGKPVSADHPYLRCKAVSADPALRQLPWSQLIMVPVQNAAGQLRSLQFIAADGARRFLHDGEITGNFCPLGFPAEPTDQQAVLLCEGVATGLTLREATGLPVACAFSCHNLGAVADALRDRLPNARIVICGDDDWQTQKPVENPGATTAKKVAAAVNGILLLPGFDDCDRRREDTDFNDMAARSGLEVVRQLFECLDDISWPEAECIDSEPSEDANQLEDELDGVVGRYRSQGGKITWDQEDGGDPVQLANFTAKITGEITVDDGVERTKRLEIAWRLRYRRGAFQLPAREFAALQWPMQEIGADAIVAPGASRRDRLRAAIQYLSGDIPRRHVYAQTGWRQHGGRWAYLHNGGAIGGTDVITELRNGLQNILLPEPPAGDALRQAIQASIGLLDVAPARVSCPLFASIYRAPLQRSDFSLVFVGQSGSGKSSIAALAQAHFGAAMADRNGLPADWSSTANALEFMAFQAADAVLVIDEGEAALGSPAARAELDNKIARILRAIGNQATRSRMMADGRMVPDKPPRALVIATKEEAIQGFSLVARTLTLTLMPGEAAGGLGVSGLGPWQDHAHSGLYAKALAGYVAWLAEDLPGRKAMFQERFATARTKLADRLGHPRTADILAQLAAAARLFLFFAAEVGAVTDLAVSEQHRRILAGLMAAANEQITAQAAADPVETFVGLLRAVLAGGRAHLRNADGQKPAIPVAYGWKRTDYGYDPQGDLIGWIAPDNSLYLLMDAAYAACQRLARETGQTIEVGPTALRKRIDTKGMILSKEGGQKKRLTNRVVIEGAKVTILHVINPLTAEDDGDQILDENVVPSDSASIETENRTFRTLADPASALSAAQPPA